MVFSINVLYFKTSMFSFNVKNNFAFWCRNCVSKLYFNFHNSLCKEKKYFSLILQLPASRITFDYKTACFLTIQLCSIPKSFRWQTWLATSSCHCYKKAIHMLLWYIDILMLSLCFLVLLDWNTVAPTGLGLILTTGWPATLGSEGNFITLAV